MDETVSKFSTTSCDFSVKTNTGTRDEAVGLSSQMSYEESMSVLDHFMKERPKASNYTKGLSDVPPVLNARKC